VIEGKKEEGIAILENRALASIFLSGKKGEGKWVGLQA